MVDEKPLGELGNTQLLGKVLLDILLDLPHPAAAAALPRREILRAGAGDQDEDLLEQTAHHLPGIGRAGIRLPA